MQKIILAGFGFMGQMHAQIYAVLPVAEVIAIVDAHPASAIANAAKLNVKAPIYPDLAAALEAHPEATVVDICLPTSHHRPVALEAIAAGKHLFCEKPLALSAEDASAIVEAAEAKGITMQVGHVVRFFPEYRAIEAFVRSKKAGRLLSLTLTRRAGRPGYSKDNWLNDPRLSLGAIFDLHIHDTDFIHHLLGQPSAVTSFGTRDQTGWSHVFTRYHFDDIAVHAEGGWNYPAQWGFRATLEAVFENGALEYDSAAEVKVRVTLGDAQPESLPYDVPTIGESTATTGNVSSLSGYDAELATFIGHLERGDQPLIATGAQAVNSVRTVLAEIESAQSGKTICLS